MANLWRCLGLVAAWVMTCSQTSRAEQHEHRPDRTVAVYLTRGLLEASGYHRYTYVLLRQPKTTDGRAVVERVLTAVNRRMDTDVIKEDPEANVFCFLVLEPPPEHFDAAWLLDHYDYVRADRLRALTGVGPEVGQVLVESERPLLGATKVDPAAVKIFELDMPTPSIEDPTRAGPPPEFTGREFLSPNETEAEGYGLYSYVLLSEKLNANNRPMYEAIVSAYLDLGEVQRFETEQHIKKQQLNVTYMPLQDQARKDVTAEWVLEHYDYVAAEVLLRKLLEHPNPAGVYIVSYLQPASRAGAIDRQKLLVQDLTGVPADLAFLWFRQFQEQARQSRYWDDRTVGQFMLRMRTQIGEIAEAFGSDRNTRALIATKIGMAH
jgi:hypothetical protein